MAGRQTELFETIAEPDCILEGSEGAFIALRDQTDGKTLVAVHKVMSEDEGFVVTAYRTSKKSKQLRRRIVWQRS
jgi:hypothetical protein